MIDELIERFLEYRVLSYGSLCTISSSITLYSFTEPLSSGSGSIACRYWHLLYIHQSFLARAFSLLPSSTSWAFSECGTRSKLAIERMWDLPTWKSKGTVLRFFPTEEWWALANCSEVAIDRRALSWDWTNRSSERTNLQTYKSTVE